MNLVSEPGTSICRRYMSRRWHSASQRTVPTSSAQQSASPRTRIGWAVIHETSGRQLARVASASPANVRTSLPTPSSSQSWPKLSIQARQGMRFDPIARPPTCLYSSRSSLGSACSHRAAQA